MENIEFDKRIENSITSTQNILVKLYSDGSGFVGNVRKAADDRESNRKTQESQNTKYRLELLNLKSSEAEKRFQEICQQCLSTKEETYCLNLYKDIQDQKNECDELLREKDATIKFISEELRKKESDYVQEIKKHEEDTKIICNRIDELILALSDASFRELGHLQTIFDAEYEQLVLLKERQWLNKVSNTKAQEFKATRERERLTLNYQDEVQTLEKNNFGDFRLTRLKLDEDLHIMQQELNRVKGVYLLNNAKLDYSFKVLSQQEEENKMTRVEQKRIKTKLHDTMVELKKQLEIIQNEGEKMKRKAENEMKEIGAQIKTLEKQLWISQSTSANKYRDVWITKEEEAKFILEKVLDADRYVAEKILHVEWTRPQLEFLENLGPIYKPKNPELFPDEVSEEDTFGNDLIPIELVFKLIAEEMGFLLEDNLQDVVNPMDFSNRSVPSLDSVFRAINIENDKDVLLLVKVFSKYAPKGLDFDDLRLQVDVAKTLKEYLKLKEARKFSRAKEDKFNFPEVDEEKLVDYWRKYASKFTDEEIWKMCSFALLKLRKVLKQHESLLRQKKSLTMQNVELENALLNVKGTELNS